MFVCDYDVLHLGPCGGGGQRENMFSSVLSLPFGTKILAKSSSFLATSEFILFRNKNHKSPRVRIGKG